MRIAGIHIRKVVFCFALVIACMLYQTASSSYGTIVAIATLGLTFLSAFIENHTKVFDSTVKYRKSIIIFVFVITISTLFGGHVPISSVFKFVLQALVCCTLFGVSLTNEENRYVRFVVELSAFVYSLLIIRYCLTAGVARNIHGNIVMFGSEFDPNYIGIPLVSACILLLDDFLHTNKLILRVLFAFLWMVITLAIIQTSSRGNAIPFVLGSVCVLYNYFRDVKLSAKKIIILAVIAIGLIFAFGYIDSHFGDNVARMTSFDDDADNGRFELWGQSFQVFFDNIFLGAGLGGVTAVTHGHCSHNTYLQILAETGLIGFCLFVPVLIGLLKKAFRYDRVIFYVLLSMFFQIFFLNALDNRCVWAILGWIIMLPDMKYSHDNRAIA